MAAPVVQAVGQRYDAQSNETFVVAPLTSTNHYGDQESRESQLVAHTLSADGFDASEDGTGRGSPLVVETLRSHPRPGSNTNGAIVVNARQDPVNGPLCQPLDGNGYSMAVAAPLTASQGRQIDNSDRNGGPPNLLHVGAAVRRLTPMEWERLMGFEDGYTLIPYPRTKLAADGPRYKAIGNSISVPTLRWLGRRIQTVDEIITAGRIERS